MSTPTVDLIMCNDLNFILGTNVSIPFSSSDHSVVDFYIFHNISNRYPNIISLYKFDYTNW
jgi:hypothetical protein